MKLLPLVAALVCLVTPSAQAASARIVRVDGELLRLTAQNASVSEIEGALRPLLDLPLRVEVTIPPILVLEGSDGRDLAWSLARQTGSVVALQNGNWVVLDREPVVTMHAASVDGKVIVRELARQCGIRNLMFDPDLPDVEGTFVFERVGCATAIPLVFRSLGWAGESAGNTIRLSGGRR